MQDQERAHMYATRSERKNKADGWEVDDNGFCGLYWWGLYEGYKAGLRRGRQLAPAVQEQEQK